MSETASVKISIEAKRVLDLLHKKLNLKGIKITEKKIMDILIENTDVDQIKNLIQNLENPKDFRNHPNDNHPSDYILLKLPFMTGMSPIAKATLRSLALWAVAADTKELNTAPHDTAFPVLFVQEQTQMGGF